MGDLRLHAHHHCTCAGSGKAGRHVRQKEPDQCAAGGSRHHLGPVSGYLSDKYGSRGLATAGLLISGIGLLGLATVVSSTPYWLLALYQALMGGGSGLFASPNTNAVMSSVVPEKRGTAAGINYMLMSTGQMLSIGIVFPLVLSRIPEEIMFHVFLYGGGMSGAPLAAFESGMHQAFLASFLVTLVAAVISALRPRQMSLVLITFLSAHFFLLRLSTGL